MTTLPQNVKDLLDRLADNSKTEMDHVRRLAEAIRRADDQLLHEVHTVSLLHEMRRGAIFGELQNLANRLCALPARAHVHDPLPALGQPPTYEDVAAVAQMPETSAGDWRQATQRIDDDLDQFFDRAEQRH